MSPGELARRWGVSPRTLERWRSEGRGPAYLKLVGRIAYRGEDIRRFEAARVCVPAKRSTVTGRGPAETEAEQHSGRQA